MSDDRARAERYAQAVLQAMVERWQSALGTVADAIGSDPKLVALLDDDNLSVADKSQALTDLLPTGTSAEIQNLLSLLIQEGDIELISDVNRALTDAATGQRAPTKAEITSAAPLSDDEQEQLRRSLIATHGDGLIFSFQVDPTLLGGLRVRVGDRLIDNSVASRLAKLRESIASVVR